MISTEEVSPVEKKQLKFAFVLLVASIFGFFINMYVSVGIAVAAVLVGLAVVALLIKLIGVR